eukprot:UN07298
MKTQTNQTKNLINYYPTKKRRRINHVTNQNSGPKRQLNHENLQKHNNNVQQVQKQGTTGGNVGERQIHQSMSQGDRSEAGETYHRQRQQHQGGPTSYVGERQPSPIVQKPAKQQPLQHKPTITQHQPTITQQQNPKITPNFHRLSISSTYSDR